MHHYPAESNILAGEVKDFSFDTLNENMIQQFKRYNMDVDAIEVCQNTWHWIRVSGVYKGLLDYAVSENDRVSRIDARLLGTIIQVSKALNQSNPNYGCMKMTNYKYKRTLTMQAWLP